MKKPLAFVLSGVILLALPGAAGGAVPKLSVADVEVVETNSATAATFDVTLSKKPKRKVSVAYATSDGTATSPADYAGETGTLRFQKRQKRRTAEVGISGDTLDELDETFELTLSNPKRAKLGDGVGTATIIDDDVTVVDGIAAARAAADGPVSISLDDVVVTYVNPLVGSEPAGFLVQKVQAGPALRIVVDPSTVTPVPAVGDTVDFTITQMGSTAGARRAVSISGFSRSATGTDVGTLSKNVTNSSDLVSNNGAYDAELIDLSGTIAGSFGSAGNGFVSARIDTAGLSNTPGFDLRLPATLRDELDLQTGCSFTVDDSPLLPFNALAQVTLWDAADIQLIDCPAPKLTDAFAFGATTVILTFDRRIESSSVDPDGSQFTVSNGLAVTNASVSGRQVTLTTSAQVPGTSYTVSVAATVTDLLGEPMDPDEDTALFTGFIQPANLVLNEVAPNITSSKDLVELRATSAGTVNGLTLNSRPTPTTLATFPNVTVAAGDLIVVHLNAAADLPSSETTTKNQHPSGSFPAAYDGAWDFLGGTTGITYSNRVLSIEREGFLLDGVPFAQPSLQSPPTGFPAELQALQALSHWLPADCGGIACTYNSAPTAQDVSVDWTGAGTTATGNTVSRKPIGDTNQKTDWNTPGPGSMGAPNP